MLNVLILLLYISQLSSFEDNNDTMRVLSNLIQKVNVLQSNLSFEVSRLNDYQSNQADEIQKNSENAEADYQNITQTISTLNATLQLQLHAISKMEGPQVDLTHIHLY